MVQGTWQGRHACSPTTGAAAGAAFPGPWLRIRLGYRSGKLFRHCVGSSLLGYSQLKITCNSDNDVLCGTCTDAAMEHGGSVLVAVGQAMTPLGRVCKVTRCATQLSGVEHGL